MQKKETQAAAQPQRELFFPQQVNGKSPDQMTPDEFELYLGLGGLADASHYRTEQQRGTSAFDNMHATEY